MPKIYVGWTSVQRPYQKNNITRAVKLFITSYLFLLYRLLYHNVRLIPSILFLMWGTMSLTYKTDKSQIKKYALEERITRAEYFLSSKARKTFKDRFYKL